MTGQGADIIICDDPLSIEQGLSEQYREKAIRYFRKTIFSRINDPKLGIKIVVMQRMHENDLTGDLLFTDKEGEEFRHICLPAKLSKDVNPSHLSDQYVGGFLFPDRFSKKFLDEAKVKMGSYSFAGQYMQRPSPEDGGILKGSQIRDFDELPESPDMTIISVDASFKDGKDSDYNAIGVWVKEGPNYYQVDLMRKKAGFLETLEIIRYFYGRYRPDAVLIEDKANGPAIIDALRKEVDGVIPVNPEGGKVARAMAVQPLFEGGNVLIPKFALWREDFLNEVNSFPRGLHDDMVDETTQALNFLRNREGATWAGQINF